MAEQSSLYRGLYQLEDPSGSLIAARVPVAGPTDLYDGTKILVRPNQVAILVYQGKLGDLFTSGTHTLSTGNIPVITRLKNWKYGFQSTLLAEIWFFATQVFLARKWGTTSPIVTRLNESSMPLRASGTYNIRIKDPRSLFLNVIGSRFCMDVSQLDDFVQAQILEMLPQALTHINDIRDLNVKQQSVGNTLQDLLNPKLEDFGVTLQDIRVQSILPPAEVLKAIDEKLAMDIIGSKQDYLMYKAANGFENLKGSSDPVNLMMSLMMSKNLSSIHPQIESVPTQASAFCSQCGGAISAGAKFCAKCGKQVNL